ncbi:pantothenate kinase [Lactobacillus selangorensis]|uniref:Pantothenate kinase n=1 Tax=Lactobacillus selangorensis TaxID=81857 RepID=A0A0R2FZN4_9LACO|nr:type I pantothenate kinase [Lactobacillus selangorensis]KRN28205.1 pantothenate kinase [Lactobacillus selangorensis]KRN30919.1 pantothenate kinase [Lactobacillus selangorensis]
MQEKLNFYVIPRAEWQKLEKPADGGVSQATLNRIKSVNDKISVADVKEVYAPLLQFIKLAYQHYQTKLAAKNAFLHVQPNPAPFIIGIAGSVAVGKSTSARLLNLLLQQAYPDKKVQQITTDGFLYPNQILKEKGLFDRKGFPESYDMRKLVYFLNIVKKNEGPVQAPYYSHEENDIIKDRFETIDRPDILIVEGINVLQLTTDAPLFVSDFFDFSLYIDAPTDLIEQWFLERVATLIDRAGDDPAEEFYAPTPEKRQKFLDWADSVWQTVNLPNLNDYILPTRKRADVVLHKTAHHRIDQIYLRKY